MLNLRFEHEEILAWLAEQDPRATDRLFAAADELRAATVGPQVHLRGLIEISNHCVRQCGYCGIRAGHAALQRYRMDAAEILDCARRAVAMGYGTVVLQAGEDPGITGPWMAHIVRQVKRETPLAVTLSLGERGPDELAAWREAGADRYLLRFETSDSALFHRIHPPLPMRPDRPNDRIAMLKHLRTLGYEIGSGIMVGIPGQSLSSIAADVGLFRELDLDMIGVGPFIPHPATPLGAESGELKVESSQGFGLPAGRASLLQVQDLRSAASAQPDVPPYAAVRSPHSTLHLVLKVIALARLACPEANIPSTTALATINPENGREMGLQCGANVVMPNLTPLDYRALYEIYPNKACISETGEACNRCLAGRIAALGRTIGRGPGGRKRA
jgi:biotin synthase